MRGYTKVEFIKDFGNIKKGTISNLKNKEVDDYLNKKIIKIIPINKQNTLFYEFCIEKVKEYFYANITSPKIQSEFFKKAESIQEDIDLIELVQDFVDSPQSEDILDYASKKAQSRISNIKPKKEFKILRIDNYLENVKRFYKYQPFFYDKSELFWFWLNHKWEIVDEIEVMNEIEKRLGFYGATVKSNIKNSYLEAFKRVGRSKIPKEAPKSWVQFKDKIFDVKKKICYQASPEYFLTNPIPWKVGESLETPVIDEIFKSWVKEKDVFKLYEIAAYCLLPAYPIHRIFYFLGSGSNGKSKFLDFVERIVGDGNFCTSELDLLSENRFESSKLYRKLVCMMGETNFTNMKKTSIIKKLSAGDNINIEFKNKNPFDAKNYAKLLVSTNSLPITLDKTKGFYRRFSYVDFPNEFEEGPNPIDKIPLIEFENFCFKSLFILNDLLSKYKFTNESTIEEREKQYEERSNPLLKFLREKTERDVNGTIFKFQFNEAFEKWCKENGHRIWTDRQINSEMKERGWEDSKEWSSESKNSWWSWTGFRWKNAFEIAENRSTSTTSTTSYKKIQLYESSTLNENTGSSGSSGSKTAKNDKNVALIWQKCNFCQKTPCFEWGSDGKPYCEECFETRKNNKLEVEVVK